MKTISLLSLLLAALVVLLPGSLRSQTTGGNDSGAMDQVYTIPVTLTGNANTIAGVLSGDTAFTTTGQVTFQSTVDGSASGVQALTINTTHTTTTGTPDTDVTTVGSTTLGAVGQTTALYSVEINASLVAGTSTSVTGTIVPGAITTLNGNVTTSYNSAPGGGNITTGAQTYGNAVVLGNDVTLTSTPNTVGAVFLAGSSGNITLNSTVDGAHALTISTPGVITLGAVGQTTALTSLTTNSGLQTTVNGGTTPVNDGFGTTVLNGNVTTTGTQNYGYEMMLGNDVTLTSTSGAGITLGSIAPTPVTGGGTATHALAIAGGGTVTFAGGASLTSLDVGSSAVIMAAVPSSFGNTITTSSANAQVYNGTVTLQTDTTLASTGGGNIVLNSTVDGPYALAISTAGVTTLGPVGQNTALGSLSVSGAVTLNDNVTTASRFIQETGSQTYGGPVTLATDITLTSTSLNGEVISLSSVIGGSHSLAIDGGATVRFTGGTVAAASLDIGSSSVVLTGDTTIDTPALTLNDVSGASHALTVIGALTLGGSTTLGSLTDLGGAVTLTSFAYGITTVDLTGTVNLGDDVTINGASATLGTVNGGGHDLALADTGATALGNVSNMRTLTDLSGTLTLNGGTVTATTIDLVSAVTLGTDVTLTGTTTLGNTTGAGHNLTIVGATILNSLSGVATLTETTGGVTLNAGNISAGTINFGSDSVVLGGSTTLATTSGLTMNGTVLGNLNALTLIGNASLGSVSGVTLLTDNGGAVTLKGNSYSVSLGMILSGAVTLGAAGTTTITDSSVLMLGDITGGSHALTINGGGTTTLGSVSGVTTLTDNSGTTTLNGNVTTTGAQTYNDAVTLGSGLLLSSTGNGTIALNSTVDGAHALTVTTGGAVALGTVGGATAPSSLAVTGGSIALAHNVTVAGPLSLTTTGSAITQSGGVLTVGGTATFNAGTDSITLNSAGNSFTGAVSLTGSNAAITDATGLILGNTTLSGTLALSAASGTTVTGLVSASTTTVNSGSLQIGNGGTAGGISGNLASNGAVTFDESGAVSYGGVYSGSGSLTQAGAGVLILNGNNTYTGTTTVQQGTLEIDGSITSPVMVNSGATLTGKGTIIGNLTANGILSPGTSSAIGALTIQGNLSLGNSSIVNMRVNGPGNSDLIAVSGTAHLAGTLQLMPGNGVLGGQSFTLINATAINGTFSTVNVLGNGITFVSNYSSHDLTVTDTITTVQNSFSTFAATPNQSTVATTLNSVAADPREAALISALNSLPGSVQAAALAEISPLQQTTLSQTSVSSSRAASGTLESRMSNVRSGSTGLSLNQFNWLDQNIPGSALIAGTEIPAGVKIFQPVPENRWGFFAAANGNFGDIDGETSQSNYYGMGFTAGADYRIDKAFTVGFAVGYDYSKTDFDHSGSNSTAHSIRVGPYATWKDKTGDWVDGSVGGAYHFYDSNREGFGGTASSSSGGIEFDSSLKYGHDFHLRQWTLTPTVGLDYLHLDIGKYTETGSLAPLTMQAQTVESLQSNLGGTVAYAFQWKGVQWNPYVQAGWAHEMMDPAQSVSARFASGAGDVFSTTGDNLGRESATFGAGLQADLTELVTANLSYSGDANDRYMDNSFNAALRVQF